MCWSQRAFSCQFIASWIQCGPDVFDQIHCVQISQRCVSDSRLWRWWCSANKAGCLVAPCWVQNAWQRRPQTWFMWEKTKLQSLRLHLDHLHVCSKILSLINTVLSFCHCKTLTGTVMYNHCTTDNDRRVLHSWSSLTIQRHFSCTLSRVTRYCETCFARSGNRWRPAGNKMAFGWPKKTMLNSMSWHIKPTIRRYADKTWTCMSQDFGKCFHWCFILTCSTSKAKIISPELAYTTNFCKIVQKEFRSNNCTVL